MPDKNDFSQLTNLEQEYRMMEISDHEFKLLSSFVYQHFGIVLSEQKRSLLVGRLQKIVKARGFARFKDYYHYLEETNDKDALTELANRISTNHTFFFREAEHFDLFKNQVMPEIKEHALQSGKKDVRIWCAASSSGEEPYTILMTMMEFFGAEYNQWDAGLLATDISEKMLIAAKTGVYPDERLDKTPTLLRSKYFNKIAPGKWAIKDFLKQEVLFRRFNLMNKIFPFKKQFDVIFCRNVMIYFDAETRNALIDRMKDFLRPGGYFFIGHSETMGRDREGFEYIKPAVYKRI